MLKNFPTAGAAIGGTNDCLKFLLLLLPVLSAALISPAFAANDPPRPSLTPAELVHGHGGEVTVSVKNAPDALRNGSAMAALRPAAPFTAQHLDLDHAVKHIAKHQSVLYAATDDNQVLTLSFAGQKAKVLHRLAIKKPITALYATDALILIGTANGELLLYDINSRRRLEFRAAIKLNSDSGASTAVTAIAVQGELAYVLENHDQLRIFDLNSDHNSNTKNLATVKLENHFNAITVSGHYVYMSGDELGLRIIDVSNPSKPQPLDGFATQGSGQDIKLEDNLAYVADGQGGLVIFDVRDPRHIRWLGSHSKLGAVDQVAVYNGMAIINNDYRRLASLEIANATLPITGSLFKPRDRMNDMLVDWPYVYVAENRGIEQVDFSVGAAIQISNEGINHGGSRRAFIRDNIAYVADWFSGLHMYDISIPHAPRHLGNFHTSGSSKGVVVKGRYAFVGDDDHGLQIIDISNPQHPQKISNVPTRGLAYTMKRVDNLIYLADHRGGFDIIDVADVHAPKVIGSFDTPGKSWAMDVVDGIAYVADDSTGLLVFDVRDPKAITQIGQFNPGGYAEDVKIRGRYAYVAFFDKGFYILDISNPRKPQMVGHTPIPGNARSVVLDDSYAYVAGWESGMQVLDISDLSAPKIVSHYDTDGSAWGVDVYKGYAYIWDWWGGVKVINVSNPLQPQAVGRYQARGLVRRLAIAGNYIYTASGAGGMQVYDIRNPLNPIWTTGLDVAGSVRDVALAGERAYLAADDDGVVIADISNPFYARWLGRLKTPGKIQRLVANDSVVVAQDERAGLLVIDASQPASPRIKTRAGITVNDMWLQGRRLFITSPHGLTVYQLGPQWQLQRLATYLAAKTNAGRAGNAMRWIRVSGDRIYINEPAKGIRILRLQGNKIVPLGFFPFTAPLEDMQIAGNHLFIANQSSGVLDIDISDPKSPLLSVEYPNTGAMAAMAVNDQAIFLAGDKAINSVTRLADIVIHRAADNKLKMQLPASLPLGNYQLTLLNTNGDKQVLGDAVIVKPAKRKKPKFTMEDFKKILEQQKLKNRQGTP